MSDSSGMRPLVIGVDPGLSGALAFIHKSTLSLHSVHDLPKTKAITGKSKLDPYSLATLVALHKDQVSYAIIEDVGVMGGHEGTVSMFNFGFGAGLLSGVIASFAIPIIYVKPAVWKCNMGLTRNKDDSRFKASCLFPDHHHLWKRKKDDGRAEAALLGYFGALKLK
jgi:crossover junction endodeoxyribonuclease RuvC